MAENQQTEREDDVIAYAAFQGLRNDTRPERFSPSDFVTAVNVVLDDTGQVSRRPGYAQIATGVAHSLWAPRIGGDGFVVRDGVLYRILPDMSYINIATLRDPYTPVSYAKVDDRVYITNGTDTMVVDAEGARSWGLVPPAPTILTPTYGDMPAGNYQSCAVFVRDDGQESGTSELTAIDLPANSGVTITVPMPYDKEVTHIQLFLSTPDGEMAYMVAEVPRGTVDYTYRGDTTDLFQPVDVRTLVACPGGQLVAHYRGQMFVANGAFIYVSEPLEYERFDLRNYIPAPSRVTMLAPIYDREGADTAQASGLFIGTEADSGVLVGSTPKDFQYVPLADYGVVEGALTYVDGAILGTGATGVRNIPVWLSRNGVCVGMPNMEIHNTTRARYDFRSGGRGAAILHDRAYRRIVFTSSS